VTVIALAASLVLLVSFILIEQRASHPLLPLHIVWNRARGGAYASIVLTGSGVFAVFLFLTYFMQDNLGLSPLTTGVAFLPMTALIVLSSTTAQTRILPRTGAKPLIVTGMDAPAHPAQPGLELRRGRPPLAADPRPRHGHDLRTRVRHRNPQCSAQ
jgi:predicted MFS family arabinose efflux permease